MPESKLRSGLETQDRVYLGLGEDGYVSTDRHLEISGEAPPVRFYHCAKRSSYWVRKRTPI